MPALAAGGVTGMVVAYSYYDRLLRPLAHTVGLWILLAVAVSAGQTARRAILRTSTAVLAAIVALHLGQRLIYWIKYAGDAYAFGLRSFGLWSLLALAAGAVLGPVFARIGRSDWPGSGATAAAVGLLVADVFRRTQNYPGETPVLRTFAVLAILTVLALAAVNRSQMVRTVLLSLGSTVVAYLLIFNALPLLWRLVNISG